MNTTSTYKKNLVFTAACTGMLLFGVSLISLGTILPGIINQFGMDEKTAGTLVALLPIGLLTGSFLFGPVTDKYGYKYLMVICTLMILLGLEGIAFSKKLYVIQISVFIIGSGGGVLNGATNALVNDISKEKRGANLSFLGVFFGIGALGMPAIIGAFSGHFTENSIIAVIGLIIIIPILFFLFIRFPLPEQVQKIPLRKGIKLLKNPILIILGLILFFESGIEGVINNWTTTFLQNENGFSNRESLFALSAFVFSLTISRLILGFLLKKISSAVILFTGASLSLLGIFVLFHSSGYLCSLAGLFILGTGCAAVFPVILGYTGEIFPAVSGTAFSTVMVIAMTGNILINYSMGLTASRFGISHYTSVLAISLIIMLLLLIFAIRRIRHQIKI
ncbi:MAG: MFS transporter [Bacteroidales bacterium]|nr:MAG: MFS transporter [Bacteroidales bacterium]